MNQRELRLLFLVAGAIVFVDTMFYAAVVPLLPTLTRELHLTKASAGVLTAGYAVGTLVGSLPGGLLAERAGPRVTLYTGLALMGGSSLAFGLLDNVALLDLARFIQGLGGACTWAGSMVWLIEVIPLERRGSAIGGALAAGIGGALFGPVVGTLAHALGRGPVFSAVVVVAVGLAVAVALLPSPTTPEVDPGRPSLAPAAAPAGDRPRHVAGRPARYRVRRHERARPAPPRPTWSRRGRDRRHLPGRRGDRGGHEPGGRGSVGQAGADVPPADRAGVRGDRPGVLHAAADRAGAGGGDRAAKPWRWDPSGRRPWRCCPTRRTRTA